MRLEQLIERLPIKLICGDTDVEVADIVFDTSRAGPETLFVLFPENNDALSEVSGESPGGSQLLSAAYEQGCRFFLVPEDADGHPAYITDGFAGNGVTMLEAHNIKHAAALLIKRFFGNPDIQLKTIALIGMHDKTEFSDMLRLIFEKAGKKTAFAGSDKTANAYAVYKSLKDMVDDGVEYGFIETASQDFQMGHLDGIVFDAALVMAISPGIVSKPNTDASLRCPGCSYSHCFECSRQIFSQTVICYVNRDEELFNAFIENVPEELIRIYGFSKENGGLETNDDSLTLDYRARDVKRENVGGILSVEFVCAAPYWRRRFHIGIPGRQTAEYALGAICIADHFGISPGIIASGLAQTPFGEIE